MSSTQDFTVYKTLPYNVYARAAGKWDYLLENQVYNSSQTVNITMTNYDGLSMLTDAPHLSAMPVDFSNTVLPWKWDYYNYLLTSKYCFMPVGQVYEDVQEFGANYTVTGSPTIDSNYVASNFSTSSFLQATKTLPSSPSTLEVGIKVTTATDLTTMQYWMSDTNIGRGFAIGIQNQHIKWFASNANRNSWNIINGAEGTTTLQANTTYWVKYVFDGSNYICYLSTTGAFAGEETTEITVASTAKIYGDYKPTIGCQVTTSLANYYAFKGSIDLNETYWKINGSMYWQATGYTPEPRAGCTYNYNDDGSAVTLNAFVVNGDENIVLTPDNSYTNGYLLGTVNIPSHDVYSYAETTTAWTQPTLSSSGTIGSSSFACYSPSRWLYNYDYYAFDGNNSTAWVSHSSSTPTNNYLEFYNPDAIRILQITIKNSNNFYIEDYEFQYSDDGNLWGVATSGTNTNKTSGGEWSFNVNVGSHKYWRIVANQNGMVAIVNLAITAELVSATWTTE